MENEEFEPGHEHCNHEPIRKGEMLAHNFSQIVGSGFGALESIQGQEVYHANVEHTKAMAHRHNAHGDMLDRFGMFFSLCSLVTLVASIPIVIWLFKWAL